MIISHKYQFIYFKIKKTAGTSTERLLGDLCDDNDVVTLIGPEDERVRVKGARNSAGFYNHQRPEQVRKLIGREKFWSYYKFASVRNPFDRVVSWYFWRYPDETIRSFRREIKKGFLRTPDNTLVPLTDWVKPRKRCLINDVIRYENLEEDTKRILSKWFDVTDLNYPHSKRNLDRKPYQKYYDQRTRQIVARTYARDLAYFNYSY